MTQSFSWGAPINCNEASTKINALYNCNWNVEIVGTTKRVANMEDPSPEAKAKVSGCES